MFNRIAKQAKWWAYAAWTLPFVALAILIASEYLHLDNFFHVATLIIISVFFSVSVFWWWWAIDAIKQMFILMKATEDNFNEVKTALQETREILKNDLGDR